MTPSDLQSDPFGRSGTPPILATPNAGQRSGSLFVARISVNRSAYVLLKFFRYVPSSPLPFAPTFSVRVPTSFDVTGRVVKASGRASAVDPVPAFRCCRGAACIHWGAVARAVQICGQGIDACFGVGPWAAKCLCRAHWATYVLRSSRVVLDKKPDDDLLSHGETPHYHRR